MSTPNEALRCRSLLYTPADRPDRYTKAWRDGVADIVCADLEDGVAPARRSEARAAVVKALRDTPRSRTLRAVRINPPGSADARLDLKAVVAAAPDLIVVPKVESARDLRAVAAAVKKSAPAKRGAKGAKPAEAAGIPLVAILETARGVIDAAAILRGGDAVAVCFGAEDLAADIGARRTADSREVLLARQWVVLCAAAAGIPALDMITADFHDLARARREAAEARGLGFAGKMCIHPDQIAVVHEAFRPTAEEVAWARKVTDAAQRASVGAGGVVTVDGRMVDVPIIRQAERVLARLGD